MDIFQEGSLQEGCIIDPAYEFCAPQYFDFSKPEDDFGQEAMQAETWFDMKTVPDEISPQVAAKRSRQRLRPELAKPLTRSATKLKAAAKSPAKAPLQDRTNMQVAKPFSSPAPHKSAKKAATSQQPKAEEPIGPILPQASDNRTPARSRELEASAAEHRPLTRSMMKAEQDITMLEPAIEETQEALLSPELLPAKRLYSELEWSEQPEKQTLTNVSSHAERQGEPSMMDKPSLSSNAAKRLEDSERANKKRKVSNDRLKEILGSRGPVLPPRSAAPLTIPHDVHFATEDRAHLRADPLMELRNGKFVSLAESVQKFQSKTPTRFHSKPRSQDRPQPGAKVDLPLTRPVEPEFLTATRVRMTRVKSSAELEEEELASMPKFKARPFSDKVRRGSDHSILKPAHATATHPEEFHLLTEQRAKLRSHGDAGEDVRVTRAMADHAEGSLSKFDPLCVTVPKSPQLSTAYRARPKRAPSSEEAELEEILKHPRFKARPLDRRILDSCGEMGVPKVVPAPTTKPEGFHLATDGRLGKHPSELPALPARKRQALASTTHEYELRPRTRATEPEPFPLKTEDRGAQKRADFMQRVIAQEEVERAQREHRAQPLPYTTDYPEVPRKPLTKEPTEPEPFPLESVWRHEIEVAERKRQLEEQGRREKQLHQFRAQPNLSKGVQPFVPVHSNRALTESHDVPLQTERRAKERAEFDMVMGEKEKMAEEYRREMHEQMKALEDMELRTLRKEMVPRARPVPSFDRPFVPHRSTREPTLPVSPPITRKQHRDAAATGHGLR